MENIHSLKVKQFEILNQKTFFKNLDSREILLQSNKHSNDDIEMVSSPR